MELRTEIKENGGFIDTWTVVIGRSLQRSGVVSRYLTGYGSQYWRDTCTPLISTRVIKKKIQVFFFISDWQFYRTASVEL